MSTNHRIARPIQKSVVNPLVRLAFRLGIADPGDALLETTTGRRSGGARQTPVCDGMDGDTFWLLSEDGREADWVKDIEAHTRVRVKVRSWTHGAWRAGTAQIVDDDDPRGRQRLLSEGNWARGLCVGASGALATNLLTVRIDLDPVSTEASI
jgi:deazaflavin-dependent oxidoreductase (nitroreductase family)